MQAFFEKNNLFCNEKEVKYLIDRFDKNLDHKISFNEFVLELTPKSLK